ncbi:MAG: hypothetical protein R3B72_49605 [Polyangiaceae bacterium]
MRRLVVAAAGIWLASFMMNACSGDDPNTPCKTFCEDLERCGVRRSVFGTSPDNCEERCDRSSDGTKDMVLACRLEEGAPTCADDVLEDQTPAVRWCCNLGCDQLIGCIEREVGPEAIDDGTVDVRFASDDPVKLVDAEVRSGCETAPPIANFATEPFCSGFDDELGDPLPPLAARVYLDTAHAQNIPVSGPCGFILGGTTTFEHVPPGPTRAVVELIEQTGLPVVEETCRVFYSPRVAVLPGRVATAVIRLPPRDQLDCPAATRAACPTDSTECVRYRCEFGPDACSDGCDNDGDHRVDCVEFACAKSPACND